MDTLIARVNKVNVVLAALLLVYLFLESSIVSRIGIQGAVYIGISIVVSLDVTNVVGVFMVSKDRVTSAICCGAFLVPAGLTYWVLTTVMQSLGLFHIIILAGLVYLALTDIYLLLGLPDPAKESQQKIKSAQ